MWVKELVLDGFKSYEVRTVIKDWDRNFNCITGQNGSGKSNVMDALTFVLGLTAISEVRAQSLTDLIYKYGKTSKKKATVSITFDNSDKSQSPINKFDSKEITVSRIVQLQRNGPNGSERPESKYLIDGRTADREDVKRMFQSVQLNIDNANFLVRQGQAMYVIEAKPKDILQKVEEAAGTFVFREEAMSGKKKLQQCETDINQYTLQLNENIAPSIARQNVEMERLREIQQRATEINKAEKVVVSLDFMQLVNKSDALSEKINEIDECIQEKQAVISGATEKAELIKEELRELRQAISNGPSGLEIRHEELSEAVAASNSTRDHLALSLDTLKKSSQTLQATIDKLKQNLSSPVNDTFKQAYEARTDELASLRTEIEATASLLSGLETGVSTSGERDSGFASQARAVREEISSLKAKLASGDDKCKTLESQITSDEYHSALKALEEQKAQVSLHQIEASNLKERLASPEFTDASNISALRSNYDRAKSQLHQVERELGEMRRRDSRLEFNVPGFSKKDVKGLVGHLFNIKPDNEQKATALELCAGGRLYNVVVETDEVGTRLLNSGLRRRITLLPLNKISGRKLEDNKVRAAKDIAGDPNSLDLALDIIDYEEGVLAALRYVFGTTLIAREPAIAEKVTFDNRVRARSITLQGDVYDPSGTLSGGAAPKSSGALATFKKYNELTVKHAVLTEQCESCRQQLQRAESNLREYEAISKQITSKEHELRNLGRKVTDGKFSQLVKDYESNASERQGLVLEIEAWKAQLEASKQKLETIQQDSAEFKENKDGKLKEIRQRLDNLKSTEKTVATTCERDRAKYLDLKGAKDALENDISQALAQMERIQQEFLSAEAEYNEKTAQTTKMEQELRETEAKLKEEQSKRHGNDKELESKEKILASCESEISEARMRIQLANQERETIAAQSRTLRAKAKDMRSQYSFLSTDFSKLGQAGTPYDYNVPPQRIAQYRRVLENRGTIRGNQAEFQKALDSLRENEAKERSISNKVKQLEQNKRKILTTIEEVEVKRIEEIQKSIDAISIEMGSIFDIMLKGCSCKLVPIDPEDLKQGLKIRVRIGEQWKDSVKELSGGQKSLVGLSFMFAMLKYRPAPMYILDEVDAALDLNHTQNLGTVIKTRFRQAQFIVVSLKDNMFTNANRLFEVSNFEGRSHIRTVK